MLLRSIATLLAVALLASCGAPAQSADPHTAAVPAPSQSAPVPTATPEACHVFTIVRAPTVEAKKLASVVFHNDKPTSLATITKADHGELKATTVAEVEETLCRVLTPGPLLMHLMKEKGKVVAEVYTPTAAPDAAADARVICDAKARGARLGVAADEQVALGLRESAGGLTTQKYRELLFGAIARDQSIALDLFKALDHDIRLQGDAAFERCTVLVKKTTR